MKVMVLGGNGFIARAIVYRLLAAGHEVVVAVRSGAHLWQAADPRITVITVDFTKDTNSERWLSRLNGVDVVINCVGVFQTPSAKTLWQIHYDTPVAIFTACVKAQVKQVIQLSALGVDKIEVPYASSKYKCEQSLAELPIDSVIWRPSFVYGAGSYGGSSLFRGLVGLPFVIPLPGKATQKMQPVHIDDLSRMVVESVGWTGKHLLSAVGSERLSLKSILNKMRSWLGFKKAINVSAPISMIKLVSWFGNAFYNSPLSSTGTKMMQLDNVATDEEQQVLLSKLSFKPRSYSEGLFAQVSQVQDRWHARLFFLRPALRLSIAFIWLWSGFVSWFNPVAGLSLLSVTSLSFSSKMAFIIVGGLIDIVLGLLTLLNKRLAWVGSIQIAMMVIYTVSASCLPLGLWANPLAPLAKNIPLVLATLVMMALEKQR
ncbi:MAG: SDR family oxidoreductase [Coxiellaceae bacterium]|nr:SDR family oxidoreductase [Coxiellaceae bacterium]